MGTFAIHQDVFARIPNLRIVAAVADGLDTAAPHPGIEAEWRAAWQSAASAAVYGNAQSHPRVKPWRDTFQRMGVSGKQFPSSVEALLRRAMKGGEPFTINPLVDLYNAISLTRLVPAGAFDLDDIHDSLDLRLSQDGDTFQALDDAAPLDVPAGEVSYATGSTIITRHIVWRQSRAGLVTPRTGRIILVSEVLRELGPEAPDEVAGDFERGLREHFGVASQSWILTAERPLVEW